MVKQWMIDDSEKPGFVMKWEVRGCDESKITGLTCREWRNLELLSQAYTIRQDKPKCPFSIDFGVNSHKRGLNGSGIGVLTLLKFLSYL